MKRKSSRPPRDESDAIHSRGTTLFSPGNLGHSAGDAMDAASVITGNEPVQVYLLAVYRRLDGDYGLIEPEIGRGA